MHVAGLSLEADASFKVVNRDRRQTDFPFIHFLDLFRLEMRTAGRQFRMKTNISLDVCLFLFIGLIVRLFARIVAIWTK